MKHIKFEKIKRADVILIAVLCIVSVCAMLIIYFKPLSEPVLRVYLSDGSRKNYLLSGIDGYLDISVENVVIRLENGRACFLYSDCPDKICINTGWLEKNGDYAACLPNGIAICIMDGERAEVDAVV